MVSDHRKPTGQIGSITDYGICDVINLSEGILKRCLIGLPVIPEEAVKLHFHYSPECFIENAAAHF